MHTGPRSVIDTNSFRWPNSTVGRSSPFLSISYLESPHQHTNLAQMSLSLMAINLTICKQNRLTSYISFPNCLGSFMPSMLFYFQITRLIPIQWQYKRLNILQFLAEKMGFEDICWSTTQSLFSWNSILHSKKLHTIGSITDHLFFLNSLKVFAIQLFCIFTKPDTFSTINVQKSKDNGSKTRSIPHSKERWNLNPQRQK